MRAIQVLSDEHSALRGVLDALPFVPDSQRIDDILEADLALEALEWREQDREELGCLFPLLSRRAPDVTQTVLAGLKKWHSRERERLEQMRQQMEGAAHGDQLSRDAFAAAARDYIEIQRRHSEVEDAQLLPLAEAVLEPEDGELMLEEFTRIEQRYLRTGELEPIERAHDISARAMRRLLERQPSLLPSAATSRRTANREAVV